MYRKAKIQGGRLVRHAMSLLDLAPTFLKLAEDET